MWKVKGILVWHSMYPSSAAQMSSRCAVPRRSPRLLLAMGRELSGSVLKEFDPEEIRVVTRAAAELKPDFDSRARSHHRGIRPELFLGPEHLRKCRRARKAAERRSSSGADIGHHIGGSGQQDQIGLGEDFIRLRKPAGQLPAQGASADGRLDPFKGEAGVCCKGHESPAGGYPARSHASHAEPQARGRGSDGDHREDDARGFHDQLRAQSRLGYLPAHGRHHQQDGANPDGGVAEEPLGIAAEVGGDPEGHAVYVRRHRQSHVPRRACSSSIRFRPIVS